MNLWFDLAQATNDFDPPYTHGVFVRFEELAPAETAPGELAPRRPDGPIP